MEYLSIQNFKFGLDRRRSVMTSVPGVLALLENAHINAGGEIEKRKAFYREVNAFPSNTFGLEAVDGGLVTFGSDANPNASLPLGVTYQQLVPPSTYRPGTGTADTLKSIPFSCNFNGKAFVLAEFYAGTFAFYDGDLVASSRNGRVLSMRTAVNGGGETPQQLADDLAAQVNLIPGWSAIANGSVNGEVLIKSPPGVYFEMVVEVDSNAGLLATGFVDKDSDGTPAQAAQSKFKVINGANGVDTFALSAWRDVAGTNAVSLTASPVLCGSSATNTAIAIAAAVNAYTPLTGYTAVQVNDSVIITAPLSLGNVTFNLSVTTTGTADSAASTENPLAASLSTYSTFKNYQQSGTATVYVRSDYITCSPSGGTSPYTYQWVECNPDGSTPVTSASGITIYRSSLGSTCFIKQLTHLQEASGYFKCNVTDFASATVSSGVLLVHLANDI
jgi:hypothetical protein